MRLYLVLSIALAAFTQAQTITYNVITDNPATKLAVVVDGSLYPLERSKDCPILYTGTAPVAQHGYSYAKVDGSKTQSKEPFVRQPSKGASTVNEFYNRNWNSKSVSKLPKVLEPIPSIHRIKSDLHRDGEIPTIYLEGEASKLNYMHQNTSADAKVTVKMSYISLDGIQVFQNVTLSLAGRSTRWMSKLSYGIKLGKKETLHGYRQLKLRSLTTDPSFIREQLVSDFLQSSGVPVSGFSYVRVMMNDAPLGLFGVIEHFKKSWLKSEFANGADDYKHGILYEGNGLPSKSAHEYAISDLGYHGDDTTAYMNGEYRIKVDPSGSVGNLDKLRDFIKFIYDAPTTETNAVATWQSKIDIDGFIRVMALEILLGFSDGYLAMADNYFLYDDPETKKFIYVPADFDMTLGSTILKFHKMRSGNYKDYPGFTIRPLMTKILEVPQLKQQFEDTFKKLTTNLVNPAVTDKRIDDLVNLIATDVEWDTNDCPHVGKDQFLSGANALRNGMHVPPTVSVLASADYATRLLGKKASFHKSVYGPQYRFSLTSVKEWISSQHEAVSRVMLK